MATTYEDILTLFRETDRKFQETDRKFQETDRKFQELMDAQKETDRKFQETDRKFQETSKLVSNLGGQWGLFVENQVAPACERVFGERGIPVQMVSQRVKKRRGGDTLEIDVLVVNAGHVVVVEVKSSLSVEDVREFLDDLRRFRDFFPEYADWQVHGAVAGMRIEDGADRYAYRQGLFVLAPTGDTIKILNDPRFQPKTW
ncbi:MAG: DUF3782 domain-containing protein [Candidatus Competibacteraceae bacterium]|jgi:hypothetical protein|nr:MAG: DUF3782 domain-containing protein [Candidatus Competibacteraceae bacterium]